ncbi:MAG: iron dependent repressor, metal binding and dimerization domain protein [Syntrophomonadaceae bacterium]|nr:iron dependent repressor, metal binding and dimerization domain protein [Syntrophomonadaceae bacterium]
MHLPEETFHTVRGYELQRRGRRQVTACMEDYIEMLYRLSAGSRPVRMSDLARALNVKLPSATKMVKKIAEHGYLSYDRHSLLELTGRGRQLGGYLIRRHSVIERFLRLIGVEQGLLEQIEKIEHNISEAALARLEQLVSFAEANPGWTAELQRHLGQQP